MTTFTPPGISAVPLVSVADTRTGLPTSRANPQGYNLMKYFSYPSASDPAVYTNTRVRGVNVWIMNDSTVLMSDPVPGVTFTGTIAWPYPDAVPNNAGRAPYPGQDNPVNNAISSSWFTGGPGGVGSSGPGGSQQYVVPGIAVEYLGGHTYTVTAVQASILESAGLSDYLSGGGVGFGLSPFGLSPFGF